MMKRLATHLPGLRRGERLVGPQAVERTLPLDRIPVFGQAGTSLPLGLAAKVTTDQLPTLTLGVEERNFARDSAFNSVSGIERRKRGNHAEEDYRWMEEDWAGY
jgi:hypothetical protein